MKMLTLIAQIVAVVAGSVGALYLLGTRAYAIAGALVALTIFMLVMTSSARSATSSNPNVELRPVPWGWWTLGSVGLAITLGGFWPILPIVLAVQKASERSAAARAAAFDDHS